MAGEDLGLKELNEIARKEKNARMLLPLTNEFYTQCQEYISHLEDALKEEEKGAGQNPKVMMLREELQKANAKVSSIFSMRQRKILMLVYNRSSGAGRDADLDSLTGEEKVFFEEVLSAVEDSRSTILGSSPKKKKLKLFSRRSKKDEAGADESPMPTKVEEPAVQQSVVQAESDIGDPRAAPSAVASKIEETVTPTAPKISVSSNTSMNTSTPPPAKEPVGTPPVSSSNDMITVVVMEELPPLMGPEAVYELSPQDVVSLPNNMALLLEKQGKVKRLDPA